MDETLLEQVFTKDVRITFSRHCISGYIGKARCQCWRCRRERGEEVTPESQRRAAEQSLLADQVRQVRRKNGHWGF